jgi:HPt (histidine-containing phosphotransfer) domain-containing protein
MPEKPSTPDDKTKAAVAALWTRFQKTMFTRLAVLEAASRAVLEGSLDTQGQRAAEEAAHKLSGSLGTFGLCEGSKIAAEMELLLQRGAPINTAEGNRLQELTRRLSKELQRGPTPPASSRPKQSGEA